MSEKIRPNIRNVKQIVKISRWFKKARFYHDKQKSKKSKNSTTNSISLLNPQSPKDWTWTVLCVKAFRSTQNRMITYTTAFGGKPTATIIMLSTVHGRGIRHGHSNTIIVYQAGKSSAYYASNRKPFL